MAGSMRFYGSCAQPHYPVVLAFPLKCTSSVDAKALGLAMGPINPKDGTGGSQDQDAGGRSGNSDARCIPEQSGDEAIVPLSVEVQVDSLGGGPFSG
jgi:hypothetical protein